MTQIETETNIPGQKNDLNFYIWHPTLVRPARKRLFCLKAKNGLIIILIIIIVKEMFFFFVLAIRQCAS